MLNNSIGQSSWSKPYTNPFTIPTPGQAGTSPEKSQPFINPDVFRPSYPTGPDGAPGFPNQPVWLPPVPSGPIIDIPNSFPIELPPKPDPSEWTKLPTPQEMPDWSKLPKHFPSPQGPEINFPNPNPTFPGTGFPNKSFPDGGWLLS